MAAQDLESTTGSQRLDKETQETLVRVGRHAILLVWSFVVFFPLYWLASMSLKPPGEANSLPPDWIFLPTVYNYIQLAQNGEFISAFANSVIMVGVSVILVLLIGVPAAYVLSRYDIPMQRDVLVWILPHVCTRP